MANPLMLTHAMWRYKLARSDDSLRDNAPVIRQFAPDSRQMATFLAICRATRRSSEVGNSPHRLLL